MGILQLPTPLVGQGGLLPATKKMVSSDDLATVTTAGYLNSVNLEGYPLGTGDVIEMFYNYDINTKIGTYAELQVSIVAGVITLNVLVPTGGAVVSGTPTAGHLTSWTNATTIQDSGIVASNVQVKTGIKANTVAWAGGGTSNAFTVTGISASSIVIPAIQSQTTGTSYIESYTVGTNTLTVTFSSDPGAMNLQYIAFVVAQ